MMDLWAHRNTMVFAAMSCIASMSYSRLGKINLLTSIFRVRKAAVNTCVLHIHHSHLAGRMPERISDERCAPQQH